jgi:hypothetical protein
MQELLEHPIQVSALPLSLRTHHLLFRLLLLILSPSAFLLSNSLLFPYNNSFESSLVDSGVIFDFSKIVINSYNNAMQLFYPADFKTLQFFEVFSILIFCRISMRFCFLLPTFFAKIETQKRVIAHFVFSLLSWE